MDISWKLFFDNDPYDEYKKLSYRMPREVHGWRSSEPLFISLVGSIIRTIRPTTIIEVGSWYGESAIAMAKLTKELALNTKIICVDTWLGGEEHWLVPDWKEKLKIKGGFPRIYPQFMVNMVCEDLCKTVIPFPNTSSNAYRIFRKLNIKPQLVYIDGSHSYEDVLSDLKNYWELLDFGGILFGDDFTFPEVQQAVLEFTELKGMKPAPNMERERDNPFFVLQKRTENAL